MTLPDSRDDTNSDPNVYRLRSTPQAEELVCEAARNDYRSEGVALQRFEDIMAGVDLDVDVTRDVLIEKRGPDGSHTPDEWASMFHDDVVLEARKRSLLKHLMSSGHWGPFEHPSATLALEGVTRVAMAQITRHRHFTFDIMSLRYCDVSDTEDVTERFEVPPEVRSGEAVSRDGVHDVAEHATDEMTEAYVDALQHYQRLIDDGVPVEEARKVLPMGTKVNIVMSGNARAWLHLLNIRGKANVQGEARRLADQIHGELSRWMPYTFEHYDENVLPMELTP